MSRSTLLDSDPSRWSRRGALTVAAVLGLAALGAGAAIAAWRANGPRVARVVMDGDNALRAEVRIPERLAETTDSVIVRERDTGRAVRIRLPDDVEGALAVPVLGLRPSSAYDVALELSGLDGPSTRAVGPIETGPLPVDFPPLEVDVAAGDREDLTLFDTSHTPPEESDDPRQLGYLVVVDGRGEVVWYETMEQPIEDARRTDEGTFLFVNDENGAREITPTGEVEGDWASTTGLDDVTTDQFGRKVVSPDAVRVDTDQIHHEVVEAPNGNLLTLGREVRTVEYPEPICDGAPFDGSYRVGGDTIIEFDPATGEIVQELSLFDVLDPLDNLDRTVPAEFCSPYLDRHYPDEAGVRDWTHANSVVVDEARNALLVSARHTDAVYALRYQPDEEGPAGELLWTLGAEGDFTLEGEGDWFFHQHAPEVQSDGSILLYDNGNFRPGTSLDDEAHLPYSRAVRYEIDTTTMTARQVWEHRFPTADAVYAPYVGDADRTPTGTVLIAHGGLTTPLSHSPGMPDLLLWGRLVEVDETTRDLVLDLRIRDPAGEDDWRIYRAERIDALYPDDFVVEPVE